MGKSSSTTKKKKRSSKYSSRGRSRKKTERTRNKPKKYRNRHDSLSYSDDVSESSVSVSSSSSEDSYRSRSRSRTRKDVKRSKRRSRAVSSSSEDSHVRKRKRPKRRGRSEGRKRKNVKRESRRVVSKSSSSSRSLSCSTCSDSSSDSGESEYERYQGTPKRRGDNKRKSGNIKRGSTNKRYSDRYRSCSSCSGHTCTDNSGYRSVEREAVVNYPKKLRSVVTVNQRIQIDSDEHKEEFIYDHYDYPSRSNDSNSREHEMDTAYKSQVPEGKFSADDEKIEDDVAPNNIETTELKDRNKIATSNATAEQRNETCPTDDTANINDLETILRQKALENLKKFRNRSQETTKDAVNLQDHCDATNNTTSISMAEPSQMNSPKNSSGTTAITGSAYSSKEEGKAVDSKNGGGATVSAKKKVHSSSQLVGNSSENDKPTIRSSINRPRLFTSALRQSISKASSIPADAHTFLEAHQANSTGDNCEGSAQPADNVPPPSATCISETPNNTSAFTAGEHSSSITPASRDASATKPDDEGEGGSQLEKKTMSVMRNGEMVEVSYKVYIPKKTPALARRPLKR